LKYNEKKEKQMKSRIKEKRKHVQMYNCINVIV